jgi:hypothetical protein
MPKPASGGRRRPPNIRRVPNSLRTALAPRSRSGGSGPSEAGSSRQLLARLVDAPHLAAVVPHLAPETLHQLIRHWGLDACGELVANATPEQLASVFDLDLWGQGQPGRDDRLDAARFGEWLEALADIDSTVAARVLAAMDETLAIAGLSRFVRVFDPATMAPVAFGDDEPIDLEAPERGPECEVGGYLVRANGTEAWDAIVALLVALDADHRVYFHSVMRGCRRLSNSTPEADGLDDLFMEPEQLMHDVALDREDRRSRQGYSTPADARAFLLMARQRRHQVDRVPALNPVAAAYFRAVDETVPSADDGAAGLSNHPTAAPPPSPDIAEALNAVAGMRAKAGLVPQRPRALLEDPHARQHGLARIRALMEHHRQEDEAAFHTRGRELAFLANTLVAGCSIQSRPFTPLEASDAATSICNLGLEQWPRDRPGDWLETNLVSAFELGWAVLYEDVCVFVTERLLDTLAGLQCADPETDDGLRTLRVELMRQREAGTPWRAREALEVIAMLDMPAWACLLGLMDECPVIPAMLTATLEGRTGAVSATAFEFISTSSQIRSVQAFMTLLPDTLRR